jgi:hypothetical protein
VGFEREGFGACGMGKENGGGGVKGERERERERWFQEDRGDSGERELKLLWSLNVSRG